MKPQPLCYNSPALHFKYKNGCFAESYAEGITKLTCKPKCDAGEFACLNLTMPLKAKTTYQINVSFKIKTQAEQLEFFLLNAQKNKSQKISVHKIKNDSTDNWIFLDAEFVPNSDKYVFLGFKANALSGRANFIMIDCLHIYEKDNPDYIREMTDNLNKMTDNIQRQLVNLNKRSDYLNKKYEALKGICSKIQRTIETNYNREQFMHWNESRKEGETTLDAKKRFFFSLENENEGFAQMQKATTILLREFAKICERNNIPYWLDFGTLLGAVRHHGFIPWDDDIDVGMMRKDIDRLEKIMNEQDTGCIALQKFYCPCDADTCNIIRIVFKDTSIKIFMDIFVWDYCESDNFAESVRKNRESRLEFSLENRKYCVDKKDPALNFWENRSVDDPIQIKEIDNDLNRLNDKLNVQYEDGSCIMWGIDNVSQDFYTESSGIIFKKERIFPLKRMKFEGIEYNVPNQVDERLAEKYGDIYTLPGDMYNHSHVSKTNEIIQKCNDAIKKYF